MIPPVIVYGERVTVNHPVEGVVSGTAQWVKGSTFWIQANGKMIQCDAAYVVARYSKLED